VNSSITRLLKPQHNINYGKSFEPTIKRGGLKQKLGVAAFSFKGNPANGAVGHYLEPEENLNETTLQTYLYMVRTGKPSVHATLCGVQTSAAKRSIRNLQKLMDKGLVDKENTATTTSRLSHVFKGFIWLETFWCRLSRFSASFLWVFWRLSWQF